MAVLTVAGLEGGPLDAAADFHARIVPQARALLANGSRSLCLVLSPAGPEHAGWRLAAIQSLAREAAPARVNAVIGADPAGVEQTAAWLAAAEAITGECLTLDGAGEPIVA